MTAPFIGNRTKRTRKKIVKFEIIMCKQKEFEIGLIKTESEFQNL